MTLGILQYLLTVIIGKKNVYFVHENMDIECRKCTACVKRNKIHISFSAHILFEYMLVLIYLNLGV